MKNENTDTLTEGVVNQNSEYSNLDGFDGSVSIDELNEIRSLIESKLGEYTGGTSIEGNGVNFNFTFNDKPFHLRVMKDDFHWDYWKNNKLGFWSK